MEKDIKTFGNTITERKSDKETRELKNHNPKLLSAKGAKKNKRDIKWKNKSKIKATRGNKITYLNHIEQYNCNVISNILALFCL